MERKRFSSRFKFRTGIMQLVKLKYLFVLFFFSICSFAQQKGEVFKMYPTKPQENTETGYVEVTKTMYGLTFVDNTISNEIKSRVETFFKERLKEYTDLKKYRLKVEKRLDGWYIENHKLAIQ